MPDRVGGLQYRCDTCGRRKLATIDPVLCLEVGCVGVMRAEAECPHPDGSHDPERQDDGTTRCLYCNEELQGTWQD